MTKEQKKALNIYIMALDAYEAAVKARAEAVKTVDETRDAYQEAWRELKALKPATGAHGVLGGRVLVIRDYEDYPNPVVLN